MPRVEDHKLQVALNDIVIPLKAVIRYCQNRVLVTIPFTTGDLLEEHYPVTVQVDVASVVGVSVVKVVDVANPAAVRYEATDAASWTSEGGTLSINYFTGLEVLTRYDITLEVLGA